MTTPKALRRGPDEGDTLWFLGNLVTLKATAADTSGRLCIAEFLNPAGFAPPLHSHRDEFETFCILQGSATFVCGDDRLAAGPGDTVLLPPGVPHSFLVGDEPLRALQITTPGGFEDFAVAVGEPARERRIPDTGPVDPAALAAAAARFGIDIVGPPPAML